MKYNKIHRIDSLEIQKAFAKELYEYGGEELSFFCDGNMYMRGELVKTRDKEIIE